MEEREALRLYALALALLPDETVAAELFMRSRSERELRHAANRWRREQGLPEPGPIGNLPELDPAQQDLALHLARRGQRRRQARRALAGLAGILLLVAAVLLPRALSVEPGGLSDDPAFSDLPLTRSNGQGGLRLSVYKAEAIPGAITLWWELTGPGATAQRNRIPSSLQLLAGDQFTALSTELQSHRQDRLLGRSVYPVLITPQSVRLLLRSETDDVHLAADLYPLHLGYDPEADIYGVNVSIDLLGRQVQIGDLRVGAYATTLEVLFAEPETIRIPYLLADGNPVPRAGVWHRSDRPLSYDLVWEPLPPGTRQVEFGFTHNAWRIEERRIEAGDPNFFQQWLVKDGHIQAQFRMEIPAPHIITGHLITRDGHAIRAYVQSHSRLEHLWVLEAPLRPWLPEPVEGGPDLGGLVPFGAADISHVELIMPQPLPEPKFTVTLR